MSNEENVELTDGFHLLIDVLKDNGIDTMYGVVGIPITNLARLWQEDGQKCCVSEAKESCQEVVNTSADEETAAKTVDEHGPGSGRGGSSVKKLLRQ